MTSPHPLAAWVERTQTTSPTRDPGRRRRAQRRGAGSRLPTQRTPRDDS